MRLAVSANSYASTSNKNTHKQKNKYLHIIIFLVSVFLRCDSALTLLLLVLYECTSYKAKAQL